MHGCFLTRSFGRAFIEVGRVEVVAAEGDDAGPEAGIGGQDAVEFLEALSRDLWDRVTETIELDPG